MFTKWCRAFPGLPEEVGHARHFVTALLTERGPVEHAVQAQEAGAELDAPGLA